MALALRVPVMAIVTASRCRALLSNFRRRIPYSLESVRARGSYCGSSFLPHKLLARPAQWSRLRPLSLSGLSSSSSYDCCTPWLRLLRMPPSSYVVGLGTHYFSSRNVATQAAMVTARSPITAYLAEFEASASAKESKVMMQRLLSEPRRVVEKYAVGDEGDMKKNHMVCLNWVLSDARLNPETELALGFLDHLMLGTPGSPLRKVLLESGIGEVIVGGGIQDELCQPQFSIGLKDVVAEDVSCVEDLVFSTLKQLVQDGFSSEAVEASMNTIEFSLRENNVGSFPRGLSFMLHSMGKWLYGGDPFQPLHLCQALGAA